MVCFRPITVLPTARLILLIACLGGSVRGGEEPVDELAQLRTGDVLCQHVPSHLSSYVADLGTAPLSNAGLVVVTPLGPVVIDTLAGVRTLPLADWISQGAGKKYLLARVANLSSVDAVAISQTALAWRGRPHDLALALDDQAFSGAELVYKAYLRGARIQLTRRTLLADLNWKECAPSLREAFQGELSLDRLVVIPDTLLSGRHLQVVASTFPPWESQDPDAPGLFDGDSPHRTLQGIWSGQYTFDARTTAIIILRFGHEGEFTSGSFLLPDGTTSPIQRVGIVPLDATGEFVAELVDARGFTTEIRGHLRDAGDRLVGTWKDERAQRGMCSLARLPSAPAPLAAAPVAPLSR
jgi:hypothetical protein